MTISGPVVARSLSRVQCDELVAHIDRIRPIIKDSTANATRTSLIFKRLIRYEPPNAQTPTGTVLTDLGRLVVCSVMADWLETLLQPRVADMMVKNLIWRNKFIEQRQTGD